MELVTQTVPISITSSRPLANFPPNIWGDRFLHHMPDSNEDHLKKLVLELKEEVKSELKKASDDYIGQVKMVDAIQRLGIEYHFEKEVDQILQNLSENFDDHCKDNHDMYLTALSFRLLRQHGYRVSCNIFDKFKDEKGAFKVPDIQQAMGVLELFEATHLRVHGEDTLDHAYVFSRNYLKSVLPNLTNPVAKQVHHALYEYSNRRGYARLEARFYISIYEQTNSHHQGLLRLAKLDYNLVQSMHQKELSEHYRWSLTCLDQLPDYLKIVYKALLEVFEEIEEELIRQGKSYRVSYGIEAMKVLVGAYFDEIKWREAKIKPTMQEYMQVATRSCGYLTLVIISFLGMGDIVTREAFDWVLSKPDVVRASVVLGRLADDIGSHEFEGEREHIPTSVECYMEEHKVSKREAIQELNNRIESAWKDINEAFFRPTKIPTPLLNRILNLNRVLEVIYGKGDWYTHVGPELQNFIKQLFVDPLLIP